LAPLASIGAERAASSTDALWGLWLALALMRMLHWVARDRGRVARVLAAIVFAAATIVPRYYVSIGNFFVAAPEPEEAPSVAATRARRSPGPASGIASPLCRPATPAGSFPRCAPPTRW